MASMKAEVTIKVIVKERIVNKGRPTRPMVIWGLILEQLINGTPTSFIKTNIVDHVKKFSPLKNIKELPSIWKIRRARTVLLVVVQTLAAYRLSLADKLAQLFTDETICRQISFQIIVIILLYTDD